MKKLLLLLFSLFLLNSPSVIADDISDFQIEGISIGDSLLDYMSEDEILKEIGRTKDWYHFLKEPNKYVNIFLEGEFLNYDYLGFMVRNNSSNTYVTNKNEKYEILSIVGDKSYLENFDSCIEKRNEIAEIFSKSFPNADKFEGIDKINSDSSGRSIVDQITFQFDSNFTISVLCDNYEETFRLKNKWSEGLRVKILTNEIDEWLLDLD